MGKLPLSASRNDYLTLKRFLTNMSAQLTFMKISCIQFHPDGSRNRESRSRSLFPPLRDVQRPENFQESHTLAQQHFVMNFMKIWQSVQSLILGHRQRGRWTDGRKGGSGLHKRRYFFYFVIIIIIKSFYSLWSTGHPWRASKRCDLQLSP